VSTIGDIESFLYSGDENYHGTHRADIHWTSELFALESRYHGEWPATGRATPLDVHEAAYLARAVAKYGPRCLCGRCVTRRAKVGVISAPANAVVVEGRKS